MVFGGEGQSQNPEPAQGRSQIPYYQYIHTLRWGPNVCGLVVQNHIIQVVQGSSSLELGLSGPILIMPLVT